ncbi:MAG: hypothetical protein ACQCN4_02090 [Candidatus Bathyarchaeia archaeon]|jgi:hypothetical protein
MTSSHSRWLEAVASHHPRLDKQRDEIYLFCSSLLPEKLINTKSATLAVMLTFHDLTTTELANAPPLSGIAGQL